MRRKMPNPDRPENSEGIEQHESGDSSEIEAAQAHSSALERANRTRTGETQRIHRDPDIAALPRPGIGGDVTGKDQYAPQDQHQAGEIVGRRLTHAVGDRDDVVQRRGGLLGINAGHDPLSAFATSSAIIETALGSLTTPM